MSRRPRLPSLSLPNRTRPGRFALATALILGLGARVGAALWENQRWALSGSAEAGTGYDSNLFARAGSPGDGYLRITPAASLARRNSLTLLKVKVEISSYTYFYQQDLNSLDPSLELRLRYPADEELLATEDLEMNYSRRTEANADVGGRLRSDSFRASWRGSFKPTGKLTLLPRASFEYTDYLTPGYNTNDTVSGGFTVAFVSNERLQLGAGYDYEQSRSEPDNPDKLQTDGRRHSFTVRGRGEFLPKVTGYAYVGASYYDYSGGVNRDGWDPVANISLDWQATARGTLTTRVNYTTYFSPTGFASTITELGLEWTQDLAGGFYATLGVRGGTVDYHHSSGTSSSVDRYSTYGELRYGLTERFSASLKASYAIQDSAVLREDYDHFKVFLNTTCKF